MWLCGVLSNSNPMEVSAVSSSSIPFFRSNVPRYRKSTVRLRRGQESNRHRPMIGNRRSFGARTPRRVATAAINDVSAATDAVPVDLTWQIVVGAIAGVTPFAVAGIEFSKRIIAQRRCEVCGGSGLVLKNEYHVRCPGCGGFLPWQSWKRFFSG